MKKIAVLFENMYSDQFLCRALFSLYEDFNMVFANHELIACEVYVYDIEPSKYKELCKIPKSEYQTPETIHKFIFTNDGKVSFVNTGYPDILTAITVLPKEEIQNTIFCMDLWCDSKTSSAHGIENCEYLEEFLSQITPKIIFFNHVMGLDGKRLINKLTEKYKDIYGVYGIRPIEHTFLSYPKTYCHMLKNAKLLCEKNLSINKPTTSPSKEDAPKREM